MTKEEILALFASPDAHHPLGPSAAERWMVCPASMQATLKVKEPEQAHPAATEGTLAHEEAEQHLNDGTDSDNEFIQVYLDYVRGLL